MPAAQDTIAKYTGILPDFLLEEWRERGFSHYMKGLLQTTNPEDYYDVLEGWVTEPQKCHVVLRTAFGSMYYLKDSEYHYISVVHNLFSHLQKRLDFIIRFSLCNKENQKGILYKDIYTKAFKRLGAPGSDEVYAFIPAIALGGNYSPDTIKLAKLKEHLSFLEQIR